jgi:hypothetical protein
MHCVVRRRTSEGIVLRGILKYNSIIASISAAYADDAPEDDSTLHTQQPVHTPTSTRPILATHLTKIASLILNFPGFSCQPHHVLPRRTSLSLASKWPNGYVARMTKYPEKEGAFDLK